MAKKKSFSIGSSLTQALSETVVAAKNYSGELHIEVIPFRKIELDPDNPRELSLAFQDIYAGLSEQDELYKKKLSERESLNSLAKSIAEQGLINPIVVYKLGENYRLVAGERRTLASLMVGKEEIPARILPAKPSPLKLSLLQWFENIEREDLSAWERVKNLEKIISAYCDSQNKKMAEITPVEISQLVGCSWQQASTYNDVLNASEKLKSHIQRNEISNLEKAALISKAPSALEDKLIDLCIKGATLKELKHLLVKPSLTKPTPKETRGAKTTKVNFGFTKNVKVAQTIIELVINNSKFDHLQEKFKDVEWNNYRSVTEAFNALIKHLEKTQ